MADTPSMRYLPVALAVVLSTSAGCGAFAASTAGDRGEQELTLEASREELRAAAIAYVGEQNWIVGQSTKSLIVARTPIDSSAGLETRERWQFRFMKGRVTVKLYLEMKEGEDWKATALVSPSYSYYREHEHLRLISKRAMEAREVQVSQPNLEQRSSSTWASIQK